MDIQTNLPVIIFLCLIPFLATIAFLIYQSSKNRKVNETYSNVYSELRNNYYQLQKQQASLSTMYSDLQSANNELQVQHEKAKIKINKLSGELKTAKKEASSQKGLATKSRNQHIQISELAQVLNARLKSHGEVLERVTTEEIEKDGKKHPAKKFHFKTITPPEPATVPTAQAEQKLKSSDYCNCMNPVKGVGGNCKKCNKTWNPKNA